MKMRWLSTALLLTSLWPAGLAAQTADDLMLVDCRLPPKIRRIGNRTYSMPARPIRTTAVDCRIRGGEYTVYDRANYETSLKVWLAAAEKGDADAQYYVAKIYEGGLGTAPNYAEAANWYAKAAAAGHSASQYELATMYEKGVGVTQDKTKALNLYRHAAGLPDNFVLVESSRYEALEQAANDLAIREQEVDDLQRQLEELKKQQKEDAKKRGELQQQLNDARKKAEAQRTEVQRIQSVVHTAATKTPDVFPASPAKPNLGKYVALIIGNSRYDHLPPMPTAESDAKAMEAVLRDAYGFQVTTLLNATNTKILSTLYSLSQSLGENDNLVVYYAGHGKRDLRNRRGWWMPADASSDADAKTNWLPNQEVSDRLALIPAKHILVLADASYVGDITRGAPQPEPRDMTAAQWAKYIETAKKKRARLALASGADEAQNSRFTSTLVDVLKRQKGVVPASAIHREVVYALTSDARVTSAIPTYAPLQSAFHDGVDFLFVRK